MGMKACNLQNLPENYTMKYCMVFGACSVIEDINHLLLRSISCSDMATVIVCRGGS